MVWFIHFRFVNSNDIMSFKIQILKMLFGFNLLIAVQLFLIVLCDGHPFRFYTQRTARNVPSMVPLGM